MEVLGHTFLLLAMLVADVAEGMAYPKGSMYRCQRSSPQLNDCVREGLASVISQFRAGDEELGVPPLDPIEVPHLQIHHDDPNLSVDLVMKNINIFGFTDIKLAKVTTNLDDVKKVEVTGKTPALRITGEYLSEGLIVNFPLHSAGSFAINMTEVTSSWVVYLREIQRNQTSYLQIDGFDIDMMPISISFQPASQLDDDNRLGDAVNIILNENSHEVYSIMKGRLAGVFSGVLTELANQLLSQVPMEEYLVP